MPKPLQKSLQDYISQIKKRKTYSRKFRVPSRILSSSTKRKILRACKHPKTRSTVAVADSAATLADVDRFLFENFKSLYLKDDDEDDKKNKFQECDRDLSSSDEEKNGGILLESPRFTATPQNLCGSHRFFVGSTSSGSLLTKSSATASDDKGPSSASAARPKMGADDFITILKYSPSPYNDFRKSMGEITEARLNDRGRVDWEFMQELLFCYLDLNEKKSYKYILSAFVDLIVVLRENSGKAPVRSRRGQFAGDWRK